MTQMGWHHQWHWLAHGVHFIPQRLASGRRLNGNGKPGCLRSSRFSLSSRCSLTPFPGRAVHRLVRSCDDQEHTPLRQGRERAEHLHGWQRCGAEELRDELGKGALAMIWRACDNVWSESVLDVIPSTPAKQAQAARARQVIQIPCANSKIK